MKLEGSLNKTNSRVNEKEIGSIIQLIRCRKAEWESAGIIPKIRLGKIVDKTTKTEGDL